MSSASLDTMFKASGRASISRGSMMDKRIQGLTLAEVKDALLALLPDSKDFVTDHIIKPFYVSDEDYKKVYTLLKDNLGYGLDKATHDQATLKMWPSYVRDVPNGTETGKFLALDFGSHHLKAEVVCLDNGKCDVESMNGFVPDKLLLHGDGEKLFDYLANFLHRFLKRCGLLNTPEPLPLGFTFAFPCKRLALNKAILTRWTKNLHCDGVVGEEVFGMLDAAIKRKGEMNIVCDAIVNDTVGTLMSGAQTDPKCAIGVILSKGVNACYMEQLENVTTWTEDNNADLPRQVVIDTEMSEFGDDGCLEFFRNEYDRDIDENYHKGRAIFEKMISGQYLGEIVRQVLQKMKDCDVLFQDHWTEELGTRNRFYSKYVSEILSEEDVRFLHTRKVLDDVQIPFVVELECRVLHHVCQLVSARAATLVAIGIACLLDSIPRPEVGIAIDGALYRFHPLFHDLLMEKIPVFLNTEKKFWLVPSPDRSGKGAAVAAAVTERLKRKDEAPSQSDDGKVEEKPTEGKSESMDTTEAKPAEAKPAEAKPAPAVEEK